ncbi:unnamed protein product, partial [Meganyctiphanes norvegica]
MSKWIRGAVWCCGASVVWCPVCVCLSGSGAWWVCACAVGLISVTLGSGYTTWSVFKNLLHNDPQSYPLFARCSRILEQLIEQRRDKNVSTQNKKITEDSVSPQNRHKLSNLPLVCDTGAPNPVVKEVLQTADIIHHKLVMPWYQHVSPDHHTAHQIRDVLEEVLMGICRKLRESGNITHITSGLIQLYIQHYQQYYRALKKVSKKHNISNPGECVGNSEIEVLYKPLHPALRNTQTQDLHFRKVAQILLQHYLPTDVSRCEIILVALRDLLAQNVLQNLVDKLCDTHWLNSILSEFISNNDQENKKGEMYIPSHNQLPQEIINNKEDSQGRMQEKVFTYTHPLAAIEEETVSELQLANGSHNSSNQSQESVSCNRSYTAKSKDSTKFENAEALAQYVRSSSIDRQGSCEEEEYKSVSSALGTLISTTMGPLLPDNTSLSYQPIVTKMWESPVDDKKFIMDFPKKAKNPFKRNVVEGMREEDYKILYSKSVKDNDGEASEDGIPSTKFKSKGNPVDDEADILDKLAVITHSLSEIVRSKSCSNLTEEVSSGNELMPEKNTLHSSLNNLNNTDKNNTEPSKEKGVLVKMLSFDDGTEDQDLGSNKDELNESKGYLISTPVASEEGAITSNSSTPIAGDQMGSREDVSDPPSSLDITGSPISHNAGFGWENVDLSPIYEESEDLASSIAKLRSLLSAKDSQHSLGSMSSYGSSESEPKSAQSDPGRYCLEKSHFTFTHKDSSSSLASVKSVSSMDSVGNGTSEEELIEAAEVPLDGRVFLNISVPTTEVQSEVVGSQYTLYVIQYDAIYLCEASAASANGNSTTVEGNEGETSASEPRMVLQTNCVRRRFREFLNLHSALEEDPKLRLSMKGVKGPNKWLNLPFSKLDSATIASRRQFLEKYLQAVIQRSEVNISTQVKEFLAYGHDSSVSFSKKSLEINVSRLDKLLARTVSGVFHSLKTALPSFESTESTSSNSSATSNVIMASERSAGVSDLSKTGSGGGSLIERSKLSNILSGNSKTEYELKLDITADEMECVIEKALIMEATGSSYETTIDTCYEARESRNYSGTTPTLGKGMLNMFSPSSPPGKDLYLPPPGPRLQGDGAADTEKLTPRISHDDSFTETEDGPWMNWPLSLGILDAIVELLTPVDHPLSHQPCVTLLTLTLAPLTHKWLQ